MSITVTVTGNDFVNMNEIVAEKLSNQTDQRHIIELFNYIRTCSYKGKAVYVLNYEYTATFNKYSDRSIQVNNNGEHFFTINITKKGVYELVRQGQESLTDLSWKKELKPIIRELLISKTTEIITD